MKKLFPIISVLCLVWSGSAYSEILELNNCYYQTLKLKTVNKEDIKWNKLYSWNQKDFDKANTIYEDEDTNELHFYWSKNIIDEKKFKKIKFLEKNSYSIDTDRKIITSLRIYSDDYLKNYNSALDRSEEKFEKWMYRDKQSVLKYKIYDYFSGLMFGISGDFLKFEGQVADILMKSRSAVKINLEELLVTHGMLGELLDGKTNDIYVCNTSSNSDNTGVSSGTAFFINSKGYLLTNNHVVEGCELQQVKYNDKDYEAKIIATDKTLDLALMKIEAKPKNYLNFSESSPEKLQKVYVAGYPFGKGLSDDLKISSGIVSSVKGYDDNSNEFQVDAPINPGNSGGPIVDDTGELIGIAVAGFAKDKSEGINFGIKSLSAVAFLKTNNIDPETSIMTFGMNNKKLLQLLEESTVYTYCN